ncbi:MAG: O-antigen ligase family protein [Bacteroidales bacterium]|nr:O-antigen ligase family protein [Bacteroidales bacterium]
MNRGAVHHKLFLFSLVLFLTGIPFCRPLMSFGLILLSANWLAEGRWREKAAMLRGNRLLAACLLLYAVHLLGLFLTSDWDYALRDLTLKLPLLLLPLLFATSPAIDRRTCEGLLGVYLFAVCASALIGLVHFHLHPEITDKREIAMHISYIRFGLNLCFGCFTALWLWRKEFRHRRRPLWIAIFGIAALWQLGMMVYIGTLTALVLFLIISLWLLLRQVFRTADRRLGRLLVGGIVLVLLAAGVQLCLSVRQYTHSDFDPATADSLTADGHPYAYPFERQHIENGEYVYAYLCEEELEAAWKTRSDLAYDGWTADGGHLIRITLIRYLNSKGLRKDRQGVEALTPEDIHNIENGLSNVHYTYGMGFRKRYYETLWETIVYLRFNEELGSVPQRMEAWKASCRLIAAHPLFGVGTGDVKDAFLDELRESGSPIDGILVRSHNQYLSFAIAFGCVGLLLCLFSLLYPPIAARKRTPLLYTVFLLVFLLSMLSDDPMERQDGVTLFAFFNSLFLFLYKDKTTEGK